MAKQMDNYYRARKSKLLKQFDKLIGKHGYHILCERYGTAVSDSIVSESRSEYEQIIPHLPFVGGRKNMFTSVVIVNGIVIAFYRIMKDKGKSVEEIMEVLCGVVQKLFEPYPGWLMRISGRLMLGRISNWYIRRQAIQSQKRKYPEDWVFTYVESDDGEFDCGIDFSECAVIKLYDKYGLDDLKPYCNFFDVTMGRAMNMGCRINPHMGSGGGLCSFRYKQGAETPVPERLKGLIT